LTAAIPAFRTAEGAALKDRCEAFADTLERNGIDVAELEGL
jgi:hypothetical protein